jgi:hypothetical protein
MSKKITKHQHQTTGGVRVTVSLPEGSWLSRDQGNEIREWLKSIEVIPTKPVGGGFPTGTIMTGKSYVKRLGEVTHYEIPLGTVKKDATPQWGKPKREIQTIIGPAPEPVQGGRLTIHLPIQTETKTFGVPISRKGRSKRKAG